MSDEVHIPDLKGEVRYPQLYGSTSRRNSSQSNTSGKQLLSEQNAESQPSLLSLDRSMLTDNSELSSNSDSNVDMSKLTLFWKLGFAAGNIYNPSTLGFFFSYTLVYLRGVLDVGSSESGTLIMLGEFIDAIFTPIIGYFMDRFSTKKRWHLIGTIIVVISFPMIYSICPKCDEWSEDWRFAYLALTIMVYHVGFAAVQLSHLALIPEVSKTQKDRNELNSVRFGASVLANIINYCVVWISFPIVEKKTYVIRKDIYDFRVVSITLTVIGIITSVIFHLTLSSNKRAQSASQSNQNNEINNSERQPLITQTSTSQTRVNFFKKPEMYQASMLYVCARVTQLSSLSFLTAWLTESKDEKSKLIATVPLVSLGASLVISVLMPIMQKMFGQKILYSFGSLIGVAAGVIIITTTHPLETGQRFFTIAILLGITTTICMVTSMSIVTDLIGSHSNQGSIVYSAVTCAAKIGCGIVVQVVQSLERPNDKFYYRDVLTGVCGGVAALGIVMLFSLQLNRSCRRASTQV